MKIAVVILSLFCLSFLVKQRDWILRFDGKQLNPKNIIKEVKKNPQASDVSLTNGTIDFIPEELLDLRSLRDLLIGNIQFGSPEKLNGCLCTIKHLTKLHITNSNITELNLADSCEVIYLRELTLVNLQLTQLKIRPWNPSIKRVTIFNTSLDALPEKFETIDHIESLTIGMNKNMDLANELRKLTSQKKIKIIALSYSELNEFPAELFSLKTLEEIQLHGNDLLAFDQRLKQLPNLKKLKLSQNKTTLSEAVKAEFKSELPNCEITF